MSRQLKLIIAGIIVLISIFGVIGTWYYAEYEYAQDKAEGELANYLKKMYADQTVLGSQCTGLDTNDNGYISCDYRVQTKDGLKEIRTVECAATFTNTGCKTLQLLPGAIGPR